MQTIKYFLTLPKKATYLQTKEISQKGSQQVIHCKKMANLKSTGVYCPSQGNKGRPEI